MTEGGEKKMDKPLHGVRVLDMATFIAAPLAATTPLWSLAYGAFVFRREKLHLRHAVVALLVVIGAVLIVTA